MVKEKMPTTKEVLVLLGIGTFLLASFVLPGLPLAAKPIIDIVKENKRKREQKIWNRYNQQRLRQILKRLHNQKFVEISQTNNQTIINLSKKGRVKYLRYNLEEIMINKPPKWDGKWRLIIYDIPKEKRIASEAFRNFLRKMECLKLQKSVYLTPYACDKEIEFLRQYFGISEGVLYIRAEKLENEQVYRTYFGI